MAERFGRFWLHEKIGHGGMAEIFRATVGPDPHTYAFDLVVKRLHGHLQGDPAQVDMFLTEADVAKFLRHPNLVQVYEAGEIEGRSYIAMEYIWGFDLAQMLERLIRRKLRFPSDLAVYVTMQVLRALDYVHNAKTPGGEEMHLVHRDVTPSNIYVTFRGEVKLADFGIARVSFLEAPEEANVLKGKVFYMPPDVLSGGIVDQRVDLWGLSVTFFEMLTGRRLYEGMTEDELMNGGSLPTIPPVHRYNEDIDNDLSRLVARALSPKPKKRSQDALAYYRELRMYMSEHGIDIDSQALARFVRTTTDVRAAGPAPKLGPMEADFEPPEFRIPIDLTPSQRLELVRRRKSLWIPLLTAFLVAAGVGGYTVWRTLSSDKAVDAAVTKTEETTQPSDLILPVDRGGEAPLDDDVESDEALDMAELGDVDLGFEVEAPEAAPAGAKPSSSARKFRALKQRGLRQLRRREFREALRTYESALGLKQRSLQAQIGYGRALLGLERLADAERSARGIVRRAPKSAAAFLFLGDTLRATGQTVEARGMYEQCSRLDPKGEIGAAARVALKLL